jgi:hypothetical protein
VFPVAPVRFVTFANAARKGLLGSLNKIKLDNTHNTPGRLPLRSASFCGTGRGCQCRFRIAKRAFLGPKSPDFLRPKPDHCRPSTQLLPTSPAERDPHAPLRRCEHTLTLTLTRTHRCGAYTCARTSVGWRATAPCCTPPRPCGPTVCKATPPARDAATGASHQLIHHQLLSSFCKATPPPPPSCPPPHRRPPNRPPARRAGGASCEPLFAATGELLPLPFLRYRRVKIQGRGRVRIQVHV